MNKNIERTNRASDKSKMVELAGIHTKDRTRFFLKSKKTQLHKIGMVWHCSMLCLLSGGPRVYAGPL